MVEPETDYGDGRGLRSADVTDDMMSESSGSGNYDGNYDAEPSDDSELKDWHIIIIAVGGFLIVCCSFMCLVSSKECGCCDHIYLAL